MIIFIPGHIHLNKGANIKLRPLVVLAAGIVIGVSVSLFVGYLVAMHTNTGRIQEKFYRIQKNSQEVDECVLICHDL